MEMLRQYSESIMEKDFCFEAHRKGAAQKYLKTVQAAMAERCSTSSPVRLFLSAKAMNNSSQISNQCEQVTQVIFWPLLGLVF